MAEAWNLESLALEGKKERAPFRMLDSIRRNGITY